MLVDKNIPIVAESLLLTPRRVKRWTCTTSSTPCWAHEEKRRGIHLAVTVVTYLLVLFSFLFFFEGFGT